MPFHGHAGSTAPGIFDTLALVLNPPNPTNAFLGGLDGDVLFGDLGVMRPISADSAGRGISTTSGDGDLAFGKIADFRAALPRKNG